MNRRRLHAAAATCAASATFSSRLDRQIERSGISHPYSDARYWAGSATSAGLRPSTIYLIVLNDQVLQRRCATVVKIRRVLPQAPQTRGAVLPRVQPASDDESQSHRQIAAAPAAGRGRAAGMMSPCVRNRTDAARPCVSLADAGLSGARIEDIAWNLAQKNLFMQH